MRKIGRDIDYTNAVITQYALEKALTELKGVHKWLHQKGRSDDDVLLAYLERRVDAIQQRIEKQAMSIEMIKRYSGDENHVLTTKRGTKITDHAIVRFFERHMGIDMNELASQIVCDDADKVIKNLKHGRVSIGKSDHVLVFKNSTVVTVLTRDQKRYASKGKRKKGK